MGVFEVITGIILLVASIFIIIVVMLQESKQQGLSGSIDGAGAQDLSPNRGKTSEAILVKLTKISATVFFILAMLVNLASVFLK